MKPLILSLLFCSLTSAATLFKPLGQPCRTFNVLASKVIKDPGGKEWFVLSNSNETTGVELIFIDFQNNTAKKYTASAGSGAWLLNQVPGDRLIVGTYYDGKLMVFDLKTMAFTKVIPFPGEEYFWTGALGGDGRLYGGTYPGGKLGALDLNSLTLEDCGAPGKPNLYCRTVAALPDGRLLCAFSTEKPVAKIYDPKSKAWSDLPAHMKHVTRTTTWNGYALAVNGWDSGKVGTNVAFKGDDLSPVDPLPFPTPPGDGNTWAIDIYLTTPDRLVIRRGNALWRMNKGEKELTKIFDQDLKSGAITAAASDGTLLGMRGQDYLIVKPGETKATLVPIPVEAGPRPPHFIRDDGSGQLWGGPQFGQTLFHMSLATKKSINTGLVCNAGGEVYDVAFRNKKVYAVSYVGGDIIEYDPAQPWNQIENINPRTIAHLATRGYIRPVGGVQFGDDGKLYSGWMASYGKYGGAIAITDPDSGETKLIENPLGQQAASGLALDKDFLYVGTELHGNGLPNKPNEQPQFGIIDRKTEKVVFQQAIGKSGISRLVLDPKTSTVAIISDSKLKLFNTKEQKFKDAPADVAELAITGHTLDTRGDGKIFFASDKTVFELDLVTGKSIKLDAPDKVEHLCLGLGNTIYISCKADIYRYLPEFAP